jgi:hypothetical protein
MMVIDHLEVEGKEDNGAERVHRSIEGSRPPCYIPRLRIFTSAFPSLALFFSTLALTRSKDKYPFAYNTYAIVRPS